MIKGTCCRQSVPLGIDLTVSDACLKIPDDVRDGPEVFRVFIGNIQIEFVFQIDKDLINLD